LIEVKHPHCITAVIPTNAQSMTNKLFSLYDVHPTGFGLYMAIVREVHKKEYSNSRFS